jgi:hypothetical protein
MKKSPLTITTASLMSGAIVLMLSACSPTAEPENITTPNLALTENVQLAENIVFNVDGIEFPEGWSIVETKEEETGAISTLGVIAPEGITVFNADQTCNFSASSYSEEAWKNSRGDLYNSKNSLYNKGTTETALIKNEEVNTASSSLGDFELVNGSFTNSIYDDLGNVTGTTANRSAIRVFSGLVNNGYEAIEGDVTPAAQYGEDVTKGVPAIDITLSCATPELLTDELWDSLVNNLNVTLVAAK